MICYMEKECNDCGRSFNATRSDARYCSPRCRTAAHRKAHEQVTTPRRRRALTESARFLGYDLSKIADRVQKIADDDRLDRNAEMIALLVGARIRVLREALDDLESKLPEDHGFRPDEVAALVRMQQHTAQLRGRPSVG